MAKQKHDIGNKKRRQAETQADKEETTTTHAMARSLVQRGLASKHILDSRHAQQEAR